MIYATRIEKPPKNQLLPYTRTHTDVYRNYWLARCCAFDACFCDHDDDGNDRARRSAVRIPIRRSN